MIRIVIVEDEEIIRKGLIFTVDWTSLDCVIVGEAEDGIEGKRIIQETKPDLVISDIKMPFKSGLEMIKELKEEHSFEALILSSYSEFEFAKKAIELEVFDYILKPVDENILKETIEKVKKRINEKHAFAEYKNKKIEVSTTNTFDINYYLNEQSFKEKYVKEAFDYIFDYYKMKIGIEDLSLKFNVSTSYLSRQFKKVTGHTFNDFLNRYRIQKSIELLISGEYKVYEVADMVGFKEYKYFSQVFKQYVKCSPLEFLKANYKSKGDQNNVSNDS